MAKKKYDSENGVWRTVGGRRIFIRNGQDLSSAMKESGKFRKSKSLKDVNEEYDKKIESQRELTKILDSERKFATRKYGELDNETELYKKGYEEAVGKLHQLRAEKEIEVGKTIKNIKNVDLPNEYGIDVKEEQVNRLRKVGNSKNEYELYKRAKENPMDREEYERNMSKMADRDDYNTSYQDYLNAINDGEDVNYLNNEIRKIGGRKTNSREDLITKNIERDRKNWENGISYEEYSLNKAIEKKTNGKYKNYDNLMESGKKYAKDVKSMTMDEYIEKNNAKYESPNGTHFAGEELYSDDPNRFGDKLRKYNNKMNPSKNDALNKVKNNRIVENVKSGDRFYEIGNGQWRSEKDGYDYYIDFNSSNIDNPKYRDVASGRIINTNPRADNYWDYEKTGIEKQMSRYKASDLSSRYRKTYEYLQETTNMNSTEILELLKRIDEDKK